MVFSKILMIFQLLEWVFTYIVQFESQQNPGIPPATWKTLLVIFRYSIAPPGGPIAWRDYVDFSSWRREEDGSLLQGATSCCALAMKMDHTSDSPIRIDTCNISFSRISEAPERCQSLMVRFVEQCWFLVPWVKKKSNSQQSKRQIFLPHIIGGLIYWNQKQISFGKETFFSRTRTNGPHVSESHHPSVYFHKRIFSSVGVVQRCGEAKKRFSKSSKIQPTQITTFAPHAILESIWILRLSFQANGWGTKSLSGGTDCCKWMFTFFPQQLLLFVPGLRFFCQVFTLGVGTGLDLWLGDAFKILAAYGNCFFFQRESFLFKRSPF